jgi:DNA invertase Pin-like site-specific DNA recombinase
MEEPSPTPLESGIEPPHQEGKTRAFGYVYVSADANGSAHAELIGQAEAIQRACEERGLGLVRVVRDVKPSPGADRERHVLEQITAGEAACLVVQRLDRLGGSASAVGTLVSWFLPDGRRLVAADLDLDTHTQRGKVAVRAIAAAGELEGRKLAERTRRGLAAARANDAGRPSVGERADLRERIALMRAEGMTLQAIADALNAEGVPTLRGGVHWRPSSVQAAAGYKRPRRAGGDGLPASNRLRPTGT